MKPVNEYLSDEKLEQLILEVEKNELVTAPPDLPDNIMACVEAERVSCGTMLMKGDLTENKVREFRRYCVRVLTSAAAAIAMVFLLPKLTNLQQLKMQEQEIRPPEMSAKQEIVLQGRYETKEEALKDTGILTEVFGGINIFNKEDKFNFFNGRNGE